MRRKSQPRVEHITFVQWLRGTGNGVRTAGIMVGSLLVLASGLTWYKQSIGWIPASIDYVNEKVDSASAATQKSIWDLQIDQLNGQWRMTRDRIAATKAKLSAMSPRDPQRRQVEIELEDLEALRDRLYSKMRELEIKLGR
jgi:hypothetical protein